MLLYIWDHLPAINVMNSCSDTLPTKSVGHSFSSFKASISPCPQSKCCRIREGLVRHQWHPAKAIFAY